MTTIEYQTKFNIFFKGTLAAAILQPDGLAVIGVLFQVCYILSHSINICFK